MQIKNFWARSFSRFLIFQCILLISLVFSFLFFGKYSKNSQARLLSTSLRNSFLVGDNRNLTTSLSSSMDNGYVYIEAYNFKNEEILKLGSEKNLNGVFDSRYSFEFLADLSSPASGVGRVIFHYSVLTFIRNALFIWIIFLIVSLPFLIYEKKRLEKMHNLDLRNLEMETARMVTEQVSHDIRSPLAVLKIMTEEITGISQHDSSLIKRAVKRIDDIANGLLSKSNSNTIDTTSSLAFTSLNKQLQSIVEEKKIQYKNDYKVEIIFDDNDEVFVNVDAVEFYRVISNLINNSYEAINSSGLIKVFLEVFTTHVIVKVEDNGKGIPQEFLSKIGERGISDKKLNNFSAGHGLGLFHAKEMTKIWNGEFMIDSKLNIGTTVSIKLPLLPMQIKSHFFEYVYIENDELLRLVWEQVSKKKGFNTLLLSSPLEFESHSENIDKIFSKIYIDNDFGKDIIEGQVFAKDLYLKGFKNLYLCTGYDAEKFSHLTWLKHVGKKCPI